MAIVFIVFVSPIRTFLMCAEIFLAQAYFDGGVAGFGIENLLNINRAVKEKRNSNQNLNNH